MQDSETTAAGWRAGALVLIDEGQGLMVRPAAFVFPMAGSWAWVEPSYADPLGAATPAVHKREGPLVLNHGGLRWVSGDAWADVMPFEPGLDDDLGGYALAWWLQWLKDSGARFEGERQRVLALL